MDKRTVILRALKDYKYTHITANEAVREICSLFDWKPVHAETPPDNEQVLAKAPDGMIYLTNWRPSYGIFTCQSKSESSDQWLWKLAE